MKSLLSLVSLLMALTLVSEGFAKPRLPRIPKRPDYALGCHNEVLKRGYVYYMSPRTMAGMIAVMWEQSDGRGWWEYVTTRQVQETLGELVTGIEVDGPTTPTLNTVIYPLEEKLFIRRARDNYGRDLLFRAEWRGEYALERHMKTFWEVFVKSCETRGKSVPKVKNLDSDARNAIPAPPMELSDYLMLAPFFRGAHLGSTEVYNQIRGQLSYYKEFFPENTASAVLPRLRYYAAKRWLVLKAVDYQSRAEGGSVYKFGITDEGKAAFRHTELFFLRMAAYYSQTIEPKKVKEIFP